MILELLIFILLVLVKSFGRAQDIGRLGNTSSCFPRRYAPSGVSRPVRVAGGTHWPRVLAIIQWYPIFYDTLVHLSALIIAISLLNYFVVMLMSCRKRRRNGPLKHISRLYYGIENGSLHA